jgi:cytochrome P450
LIRPGFTRAQVADLSSLETHVQALISCLPTTDGTTVDLQPLFFNLTIDSATDFLLGHSVSCQGSAPGSAAHEFSEAFDYAESVLDKRAVYGPLAFLLRDRRFDEACNIVHRFMDEYIQKALKSNTKPGRYNLLAELASSCRDPVRLRDELLNVLLAARDTTAGLLSSVFYFLAAHPETWDKLSKEVDELGGEVPDYKTLKEMKFLKSVLNESKQFHPPPGLGHVDYVDTGTNTPGQPSVFSLQSQ